MDNVQNCDSYISIPNSQNDLIVYINQSTSSACSSCGNLFRYLYNKLQTEILE
jgi:hypothetical protein